MPFKPTRQELGVQLGIFIGYLLTAKLGQLFAFYNGSVSPVWLPAGIALSAVWIFGRRVLPPIFLAVWIFNSEGAFGIWSALCLALASILTTDLMYSLSLWTAPKRDFFASMRRLVFLITVILPIAALVPAIVGPSILYLEKQFVSITDLLFGMSVWFFGDLIGAYLIVPIAVGWREFRLPRDKREIFELAFLLVGVVAVSLAIFSPEFQLGRNHLPMTFLILPFLLWLAFRYGPVWAGLGNLLLACVAVPATFLNSGPYTISNSPHESLVLLDVFLTFSTSFTLFSASFAVSRARFEQKILESESRFRKMADNVPIMIWLSKGPFSRTEFNRAWVEFTGLAAQNSVEDRWLGIIHPDDRERCRAIYSIAYRDQSPFNLEYRLRRRDGLFRWVREEGVPRILGDGTLEGYIGCCADVTDERQVRQQLRAAKDDADKANQAKSDFLATISHEIRTPLTAILGYSELMARAEPQNNQKDFVNFAERIQTNAFHLKSLVDDVLDLSKIEAGKIELELCEFSLPSEIRRVIETFDTTINAGRSKVAVRTTPGTPDYIISDPTRFRQIVGNVIGNAIKFTNQGNVWVDISVERHTPPNSAANCPHSKMLKIVVSDTGVGMTEEQSKRVFDPFEQGDSSTTRRFGGTGLGLPLARKLAQKLGGDVSLLASEIGKGSKFEILISAGLEKAHGIPLVNKEQTTGIGNQFKGSLQGISILVAEDSIELRELIRLSLTLANAATDFACDGMEAIQMAKSKPYDFIFMDLQMPRMDGFRAIETLRSEGLQIPMVALTARLTSAERERVTACGAVDCLAKPFHFEDLIRMVYKHVHKHTPPLQTQPRESQNLFYGDWN